jgi:hypothetical protein
MMDEFEKNQENGITQKKKQSKEWGPNWIKKKTKWEDGISKKNFEKH